VVSICANSQGVLAFAYKELELKRDRQQGIESGTCLATFLLLSCLCGAFSWIEDVSLGQSRTCPPASSALNLALDTAVLHESGFRDPVGNQRSHSTGSSVSVTHDSDKDVLWPQE
jgi:hypothetical protein